MPTRLRRAVLILAVAVVTAWQPAAAEPAGRRVALLIGVSDYGGVDDLANPANDATRMGETLGRLGFDVRVLVNPTHAKVEAAVAAIESGQKDAPPLESLLFFFSGHGGQQAGVSQLILGDTDKHGDYRTLDLAGLTRRLGELGAAANVFVLDACREDDAERIRGGKSGLAPPPRAAGAFFAYAAAPGDVAYDEAGWAAKDLSPFTFALIDELLVPGQDIGIIMRKVRARVTRETQGQQVPWTEDALTGPLVLNAAPASPALFDLYGQALKGDALAARDLGHAYLYGQGVAVDVERGMNLLRTAADRNDTQAMLMLGAFEAERDRNALQPGDAARGWYERAADAGSAEGAFRLAEMDMARKADGQRPGAQTLVWYRRAMAEGHALAAARYLALNLTFGMDPARDRAATLSELRAQAASGNVAAMVVLGQVYSDAQAPERDDPEAVFWFARAAAAGSADALLEQARMAGQGLGGARDLVRAHELTRQAAERGHARAMLLLARQLQQGEGVAADPAAALIWLRRAAAAGEAEALYDLGHAAERGLGRDRDVAEAVALYRRGAALKDPVATRALAVLFEQGVGVRRNLDRAIALYLRAAGQGDARAQAALGILANSGMLTSFPDPVQGAARLTAAVADTRDGDYVFRLAQMTEQGKGVPADAKAAVALYRRAAQEGSAAGAAELAALYKLGEGVPRDDDRAMRLWTQAAVAGDAAAYYNLAVSYGERAKSAQDTPGLAPGAPGDDAREAGRWARRGAEAGNDEAMTLHARNLWLGEREQRRDPQAALDWLARALALRNGWAAGTLLALATGDGLPATPEESDRALFVLVEAVGRTRNDVAAQALRSVFEARSGLDMATATADMLKSRLDGAQRGLALLLLGAGLADGRYGGAPDPMQAAAYYRQAIAAGEPLAHRFLGDLIADGRLPGVGAREAIAAYTAGQAAGDAAAANNLGVAYRRGLGAPADPEAAFASFQQAARAGLPDAMYNLGVAYQRGLGVRASPADAERWYEAAIAAGHRPARLALATVLLNEQEDRRDYSRAFFHLAALAGEGSTAALQSLGDVVRHTALSRGVRERALSIVVTLSGSSGPARDLLDALVKDGSAWPDAARGYRVGVAS